MSDTSLAPAGPRHGLVEAVLGGSIALVVITVAHASLPDPAKPQHPLSAHPPLRGQVAPLAPAAAPPLIAFRAPLPDGEVGSPFGLRQLPWEAHARLHAGEDMIAPAPEDVRASADGVVARIGEDPGYGRFVELTHAEGLTTLYGHLERFAPGLRVGAAVKAGVPVGRLGSTGSSTGVHLHFEVHDREGRPLNPELFLGKSFAEARDLPLALARRVPRGVRVAYVSRIPRSKRALMQAKLEDEAEAAAADTAPSAGEAGVDAAAAPDAAAPMIQAPKVHGRPHVRFRARFRS